LSATPPLATQEAIEVPSPGNKHVSRKREHLQTITPTPDSNDKEEGDCNEDKGGRRGRGQWQGQQEQR
jgi:hypothetical protein